MSGLTALLGAQARASVPFVPTRFVRYGDNEQPQNHCGLNQVLDALFPSDLSEYKDPDGSFTRLYKLLVTRLIPQVTSEVVLRMGTPYDWCRTVFFKDGSGTDTLVLPFRNIAYVNVCFLRVLPSLPWYRFRYFRNADGTEFPRIGGVEPAPTKPMSVPPNLIGPGMVASSPDVAVKDAQPIYTGIEDVDMLVDTKRRMLRIPPRVLIAGVQFPIWNYTFTKSTLNVEVHFAFGFPPTKYEDGSPLQYDPVTGQVLEPKPASSGADPSDPMRRIDYASGMPAGLSNAVATLVANRLLRRKWRAVSNGMSSVNVDGASESYGSSPYGGDLTREDKQIMDEIVSKYGISVML